MIFLVENSESNEKCEKTLEIIYISSTEAGLTFGAYFFQTYSVMFYIIYVIYEQFCVLFPSYI